MTVEHPGWSAYDAGRRRGYCMVPGILGTKQPLVKWKPYQTRLPSDTEVAEWKRQSQRINPLMLTGAISGLVVADCDGLEGYIIIRKRGKFPETVIVQTPRGDFHRHYWFRYPGQLGTIHNFAGGYDNDLPHVDLRADGGLAVYPGGINRQGIPYKFREGCSPDEVAIAEPPPWLYDYIAVHNEKLSKQEAERWARVAEAERLAQEHRDSLVLRIREQQGIKPRFLDRMQRYAAAARANQLAKLETAVAGTRNSQLFKSAAALAAFINKGVWTESDIECDLTRAAIACGLDRDPDCGLSGIQATIRSGIRRGINNRVILADPPQQRTVRV